MARLLAHWRPARRSVAVACALLLSTSACGGSDPDDDRAASPAPSPDQPTATGPTPGLPGDYHGELDGRMFDVHMPTDLSGSAPAMLVLHGRPSNSGQVRGASELDLLADQAGLLAVYPSGTDGAWLPTPDSPDTSYLLEVIDTLVADWNVDPSRIYVAGISNGADMALTVAAEHPERIAGVALVVPSGTERVADVVESAEQIVPTVAFLGEQDGRLAIGERLLDDWRSVGECSSGETVPAPEDAVTTRWECADGVPVEVTVVREGGHSWFGRVRATDLLSATRSTWDFFESAASRR